ncbi:TorF family putative porin [Paraferrimonas sp. SM1919]|uniref:TorF family putative porin n=1 Tax=Paraferrimonas sp. SM1919 TaxID=2662263 RepID=UPI0013D1456B|nr:TorF family putative porin [Paraferrimonas sp. SM1919]
MKKTKLAALVITAGSLLATPVMAEVSLNAGVVSNYLWRGLTQTNGAAAVQGGIDFESDSGVYVGSWASNVDFGDGTSYELDFYGGYAGEVSGFNYDLGVIYYAFPDGEDSNATELYLSAGYDFISMTYSKQIQSDWDANNVSYLEANAEFELTQSLTLGLHAGKWLGSDTDEDTDINASLTRSTDQGDISLLVSKSSAVDYDDAQVVVGYAVAF